MATPLKYMVDEKGDKTSVLVPIKTWEKINQDYSKLQNKLKVLTGIKEGLAEIREITCLEEAVAAVIHHVVHVNVMLFFNSSVNDGDVTFIRGRII